MRSFAWAGFAFLTLVQFTAQSPAPPASAAGSLLVAETYWLGRQVTDASGIWQLSSGEILTVMESEGGTIGLLLSSNLASLGVFLGTVSGDQLSLTSILNPAHGLVAVVSGATMNGSLTQGGPSIEFSAARLLAPLGSAVDGVYQTDSGAFLVHFSTDSSALPTVLFEVALAVAAIEFDIYLGATVSSDFSSEFNGSSIFGARSLQATFRGPRLEGAHAGSSTAAFSGSRLLRFCAAAADFDGDGAVDDCDVCPSNADAGQSDGDADGAGDACDICPGADDFADADGNGRPDCLAAAGEFAGAGGVYSMKDLLLRFPCYQAGQRFQIVVGPNGISICGLPQNACRQASAVQGNQATFDNIQFFGSSNDWHAQLNHFHGDDDDDDDRGAKPRNFGNELFEIAGPLNNNFGLEQCRIDGVGAFVEPSARACRYRATFAGSCPGIGTESELCMECPASGRCRGLGPGQYTILIGSGTQFRECQVASISRIDQKCGACQGLAAVPRPDLAR